MRQIHSKFGAYYNPRFVEIWDTAENFLADYKACEIPQMISDESATTLFYLLYARYGNNIISSTSRERFKYMLFSLVFQYGATWEKRVDIQKSLRGLSPDDLITGNTQINNVAFNPNSDPSTQSLTELEYISEQRANKTKRGKLEGYAMLMALLEEDVTGQFLDKFRTLFIAIAAPQTDLLYYVDGGEPTENDEYLEV